MYTIKTKLSEYSSKLVDSNKISFLYKLSTVSFVLPHSLIGNRLNLFSSNVALLVYTLTMYTYTYAAATLLRRASELDVYGNLLICAHVPSKGQMILRIFSHDSTQCFS